VSKPLAGVFVGEKQVGTIQFIRQKYAFVPEWDAGPGVPEKFYAPSPEEMRVQLAERGLRYQNLAKEQKMQDKSLENMLLAEREMASVWKQLTPTEKQVYLTANPNSRFASTAKVESEEEIASLMEDDPHAYIRAKLAKHGWTKSGKNTYSHKNGRTLRIHKSPTHAHHVSITHKNGDVTTVRANRAGRVGYNIVKYAKSAGKKPGIIRRAVDAVRKKITPKKAPVTVKKAPVKKAVLTSPTKEKTKRYAEKVAKKAKPETVKAPVKKSTRKEENF
jgi:hypothetical protein